MNPLNYPLSAVKKAVYAAVFLGFAILMLVLAPPIGLQGAVVALVGPVFAVIGVFAAKNHSPDDLQKALEALKGAALAVVGYFTAVPTGTDNKLVMLVGAIVMVFTVYWSRNVARPQGP